MGGQSERYPCDSCELLRFLAERPLNMAEILEFWPLQESQARCDRLRFLERQVRRPSVTILREAIPGIATGRKPRAIPRTA